MSDAVNPAATSGALHPVARLPDDWAAELGKAGQPSYRADQVFRWIHQRGVTTPSAMKNLPKVLREDLARQMPHPVLTVADVRRSADGTRKLLANLADGRRIECVLIPMTNDASSTDGAEDAGDPRWEPRNRVTLCVSTQVGCAMGCVFCASGQAGLQRGLRPEEIVSQVHAAREQLQPDELLSNLVFMGMGEPLHHYDSTARAIRLITHPRGLDMSPRRITVSTVGLIPGIRRLGDDFDGRVGLAVSLHSPTDEGRSRIIPMNQRYPLADLMAALREYPLPKRRRITIEYTLIAGENDDDGSARALSRLLEGIPVKINLIPMNAITESALSAPPPDRVDRFRDLLVRAGYSVFVRQRRGDDVAAACGQLALVDLRSSPTA